MEITIHGCPQSMTYTADAQSAENVTGTNSAQDALTACTVAYVDLQVTVSGADTPAGGILAEMTETIVGVPCCETEGMVFAGADGRQLEVRTTRQEASPHIHTIRYLADQPVNGTYSYCYRVYPRQVGKEGHSAPLFDFRREAGGVNGAGVAFLALPLFEQAQVSWQWDLSAMPQGAGAVCAFFEGDGSLTASRDTLLYSYYACGLYQKEADADFGMYWFAKPPFDVADAAARLRRLFAYMKDFFGEKEALPYRIFVRKDPFDDSGHGTAGQRSFLFGYSDKMAPTVDSLMDLLSHEMVHNWPTMSDEPAGAGTWYVEGCAEYYSIVLPLRAGITDLSHTERALNRRCEPYFGNPYRFMPNLEAGQIYWKDSAAQRMPYGRGFFYLARTDQQIRTASDGQRSLDDIVLALCAMPRGTQTEEDYLRLLRRELGEDGVRDFYAMKQGALMLPSADLFDGAFDVIQEEGPDDNGRENCIRCRFQLRQAI